MSVNSNNKLRILHIVLSIGETNTTYNEHCLPLAEERDITICTYFRSNIVPSTKISLTEGDNSLTGFFRVLRRALDTKEYDVIHAHTPHVGFLYLVSTLFGYRKLASTTVFTVHGSYSSYKLRNLLLLMPVFAAFQRVICCSQASLNSFPAFYKRLAGDRLGFVQNGLDIARADHIAAKSRTDQRPTSYFTIISISRLLGIKNPFAVLSAFQQSMEQNNHLIYIGSGPLGDSLINKSREAGLNHNVEFTGTIPREKVYEHLLNADLFISTSRGEGLPVSVLEAMACRCPVLLSDIPPHREIAGNVDFIPLIKPDDITGFAREIKKFKEMSDSERARIGQACRNLVEQRFSLTAMHAGYAEVYAQITNRHSLSTDNGRRLNV